MTEWPRPDTHVIPTTGAGDQLVFNRFELVVTQGPDQGLTHEFGQERVQVGTARTNELVLTDRTVSRYHLKIETAGGTFTIADLGSTNGTFLGGFRIHGAFLDTETRIGVGNTELLFRPLGDQATVELPAMDRMDNLIGASPKMRQLYALISRVAGSDLPVIIEGETGTGKELVARLLHDNSPRADEPFEVLDCGAIPENLIESELFGHVRGAYTGADRDRQGIFERATGGTVFLDELGELKPDLQPKLLRVLESHEVRRVGDDHSIQVDVRVLAATHRSLDELVNKGLFREDLYYRLAGCKLELPPLRDRPQDIPLLADHFLKQLRLAGNSLAPKSLDTDTATSFMKYAWPGNVRQLRNAVERLAIMGKVDLEASGGAGDRKSAGSAPLTTMREAKEAFERRYLEELLRAHDNDVTRAAAAAEIHPKSLARLLRRYAIERG